jgi:hypothetical protein
MSSFADALADAGGPHAARERIAQLRTLLTPELERAEEELHRNRSGYEAPVMVVFGATGEDLFAAVPVPATLRADANAVGERAWLVTAAVAEALLEAVGLPAPASADELVLRAGELGAHLVLAIPAGGGDEPQEIAELAVAAYDEATQDIDRLRTEALAGPAALFDDARDLRAPVGATHPLRVAEAVARLGGRPADPASVAEREDAVLALLDAGEGVARPHEDPDPARRIARRILQRLDGMGKWGGYHTDFAHLARGFAGNERALADEVGEVLLREGLLAEKPSVGQRHVYLNPRRAGDIRRLIEAGDVPAGLRLPQS